MSGPELRCRLIEMDLAPILGVAGVGHLSASQLPAFIQQTHAHPDPGHVLMQMCQVCLALGQDELALNLQARALAHRQVYRLAGAAAPAVRLLALMGPGGMGDNAPLDFIAEHLPVRLDLVFITPERGLPETLPDHDIAIVAIGESAANAPLLAGLEPLLARWPRPLLNRPERVGRCARDALWRWTAGVTGLWVPQTQRLARGGAPALPFPLTVRPVDLHAGEGLARVETPAELQAYLQTRSEDAFYLSEFIDYRSDDGAYRKYRIALIDGEPWVCHLAISSHWVVHYKSAGMNESADKRHEEAARLEDFARGFGLRHGAALRALAAALGLEHVVIDCAQAPDGRLLIFEADTRGWVHATDPVGLFPYKPPVMGQVFDAFLQMLQRRMPTP